MFVYFIGESIDMFYGCLFVWRCLVVVCVKNLIFAFSALETLRVSEREVDYPTSLWGDTAEK